MMLNGGCLCGATRYAAKAAPFNATICHCRSCRLAAGAASVAWFSVPAAAFRWTAAAPTLHRSSPPVERSFCATCGTALTYRRDDLTEIDIATATLDDPEAAPPRDHTQAAERLAWDVPGDGLPVYEGVREA